MTVVAKAMSNGYPMGAVVGSRAVMAPAKRMFISSSYWSDNIGLVAALTTIRELKRRDSQARFREIGEGLCAAMNDAIAANGLSGSCQGLYAHPVISLELPDEALRRKVNTLFTQEMARRGVHCITHFYLNLAHTEEEIRLTGEAATEALAVVKSGLEAGDLDSLLACDLKKEPFRRLVR
jgi:glutamate-1-semialdehyde 2,1-aminomutase